MNEDAQLIDIPCDRQIKKLFRECYFGRFKCQTLGEFVESVTAAELRKRRDFGEISMRKLVVILSNAGLRLRP